MKKDFKRRLNCVLPLLLAILIVAGCAGGTVNSGSGGSAFTDVTGQYSEQFAQLMKDNMSNAVLKTEDAYETRTVLISLSQKSLVDYAGKQSVSSYATTAKGQENTEKIHAQQDKVLAQLKKAGIDYELEYRYVAIDNAIAVTIDTAHVAEIKKMSGVESVVISRDYAYPQTVQTYGSAGSAVVNHTSVYNTGVYDSSLACKEGLDGTGMVVAIIDTGLDYTHAAFQEMPDSATVHFTREDIANILANKDMRAEDLTVGGVTVDDVYYNAKVPFMYDYADKDPNVYPSYSNHGTHVAGIVAGHDPNGYTDKDGNHVDEDFWGVAPNAQLVICKVFTDNLESTDLGGAVTEDILAALEDCIMLGVDVINMSLGTTCGFTTTDDGDDEGEYLNKVYTAVGKEGISLVCAASNDYSAGFGGVFGTNLSTNPDSGTVGSPSTFPAALSVASISGKKSNYLLANGEDAIFFQDSNDGSSNPFDFVGDMLGDGETSKEFEYVVIPGIGEAPDYTAIQDLVKGKIAVVKRGGSSFQEKVELAEQFGAIGIIIYNNVSGTVRMSLGDVENPIPAISIDMKSGAALVEKAKNRVGTLELSTEYKAGPFMSEFSSWGCTSDLKLKPEITAHGGEITSTIPGGYGEQSGTSMASPNMAGVIALVRSYVQDKFPEYTSTEVNRLVNQLMMSTATTVYDQNNLPYSPRKQGAGLGSLENARHTIAYLWTNNAENDNRPKIELGDDKDKKGEYTLAFYVTNFGTKDLIFKTNTLFMTETLSVNGMAVAEQAYMLKDIPAQWVVNGENVADGEEFTVPAGQSYEITVKLALSDNEKDYINKAFANGMFVEGFAKLLSQTDDQCDLVLPFMGFFGDWSKAPMLDWDVYELAKKEQDSSIPDDEKPQASIWATQPYVSYQNGQYTLPMGSFLYLQDEYADQVYADMEHNSISCYNNYYGDTNANTYLTSYKFRGLYAGLLRNARYVDYKLTNADTGEVLESDTIHRVGKAYASAGSTVPAFVKFETDPTELGLVSGEKYTMTFDFYLDYENQDREGSKETYEFSFYADYEAPVLQDVRVRYYDYKDGNKVKQRIYLDLDVFDNHYAQSVMLTYLDSDGNKQELKMATEYVTPVYNANKNGTTTVSIEITDIYEQYKDRLYVQLDDYALNHSQYWLNLSKCNQSLSPDYFELAEGEETIELGIYQTHKVQLNYEGNGNLSNFNWSSNNRSVAEVKNGEIVGLTPGTATITVTNSSGLRQTIKVTVKDEENKLPLPSISFGPVQSGDGYLTRGFVGVYPGENFKLTVNTDPWYYPVEKLTLQWESTNSNAATVDQQGNVYPLAEGSTVIKAIIVVDGKPTAYMATMTIYVQDPFVVDGVTLTEYRGLGGVVQIPEDKNIMMISEGAFEDNDNVTDIIIPKTVMQIGKYAFRNCTALKSVSFEEDSDINIIYQEAFAGCTSLELVDLTNVKILTLGRECFRGCTSLKEVKALNKATTLDTMAFAGCTSLKSVDLSGLYVCGVGAFSGCTSLTDVKTASTTNLGSYIFQNCVNLRNITLSAAQIGDYAFAGCSNLNRVTIAPAEGESSLSASIGANAFAGCSKLSSISFAQGAQIWSIGDHAFANTGLVSFQLPSGLSVLGNDILAGTNVSEIVINDDFDFDAIRLSGLTFADLNVKLDENCHKYVIENGVLYNAEKTQLLLVLAGTKNVTIPETVERIGDYAFAGSNVSNVTIPASVKTIGTAAFAESGLNAITFAQGSQITLIPAEAFAGSKLYSIEIPASVTEIGDNAFADTNLMSVSFAGDAVETLGDYVFANCKLLTNVVLPDGISTMGDGVFYNCGELRQVVMPSVEELGDYTFFGCDQLTTVTFGDNATCLGNYTFTNCTALTTVTFGEQVNTLGEAVFAGCTALENIDLKNVTVIGKEAFAGCTKLGTVTGLNRVTSIGELAFYNCNGLKKLDLEAAETIGKGAFAIENGGKTYSEIKIPSAKEIGAMAFYGGSETTVTIPATLTKLGYGAFANSQKLTAFVVEEGGNFFEVDGVLLRNITEDEYELCAFPGGKVVEEGTYSVPDNTTRIDAYAFSGLSKNAVKHVILPWSVRVIGVSAFENSGIRNYTFNSIQAPTLACVYRADVYQLMEEAVAGNTSMDQVAVRGLYYANFDTLMIYYSEILGGTSDLVMNYPENGKGYDNYIWTTYFGERNSMGVLMDDITREAITAIEGLESLEEIQQWMTWEVNDENLQKVEALVAKVTNARQLFNKVTDATQKEFIESQVTEKLEAVEKQVRALKEKFGIKLVIDYIDYDKESYKKNYIEGEAFDMTGLVLTLVYKDGSTELVDMSKVTVVEPQGALTMYDRLVTLEYRNGSVVATVDVLVSVKAGSNAGPDTEPDVPSDPTEPADPTEPTEPADPTEPTEPQPGTTSSGDSNILVIVLVAAAVLVVAGGVTAFAVIRKKKTENGSQSQMNIEKNSLSKSWLKWIIIGLLVVAAIALIIVLGGGGKDDALGDVKAEIHYFANGGEFDDHMSEKTINYYEANTFPLNIGFQNLTNGNVNMNTRNGYEFEGWYLPVRDENGELVYEDEAKTIVKLGEAFDFTKRLEEGANIDLYAKWRKLEYVSVILAGTDLKDKEGNTYTVGDQIREIDFENGQAVSFTGSRLLSLEKGAYTFVEYYYDAECTQVVSWPIQKTDKENYEVYAKFIEGDWEIVNNKASAEKMLKSLAGDKQYYVIADIDMGGATVKTQTSVKATIEGNGHTISNFSVSKTNVSKTTSLFGDVKSEAKIQNLKLKGVELTIGVSKGSPEAYFLFNEIAKGAKISGLEVQGTLSVDGAEGTSVTNIQNAASTWVIGGDQSKLTDGSIIVEVSCSCYGETYSYPLNKG